MSDLRRCHGDVNDRLKRLVDEDGPVKRIVDPCEKAQAEVNDETLGVTNDLGVEGWEPQLEKRHLENPHGDGMWKPHVTQQEHGTGDHTRRGEHPNHDNSEHGETSHGTRQSRWSLDAG